MQLSSLSYQFCPFPSVPNFILYEYKTKSHWIKNKKNQWKSENKWIKIEFVWDLQIKIQIRKKYKKCYDFLLLVHWSSIWSTEDKDSFFCIICNFCWIQHHFFFMTIHNIFPGFNVLENCLASIGGFTDSIEQLTNLKSELSLLIAVYCQFFNFILKIRPQQLIDIVKWWINAFLHWFRGFSRFDRIANCKNYHENQFLGVDYP